MTEKLFNRNFLLLWLGQSVSQLGNGAGFIGLLWWIQVTTGSAVALGTLAMMQTLVAIAIGPFAGAAVDRLDRKVIILLTDVVRGVNFCILGWLALSAQLSLPLLFALSAINAVCGQFFNPAVSASIPLIVPNSRLQQANSLNQVSVSLTNVISYGAGGVLVAFFGVPALLITNGVSFLLSAFSEAFITIPSVLSDKRKVTARLLTADLKEGFAYLRDNPVLFKVMQVAMILNFFSAPLFILLPKFVNEQLSLGSEVFGYILSAQMAGALLATLLLSAGGRGAPVQWVARFGLVIMGSLTILFAVAPVGMWWIHIGIFGLLGVLNSVVNVYFGTVLQRVTKPEFMGKVFGMLTTISHGLQPLSQGMSGLVAEFIRLPVIYGVCGLAVSGGGLQFGFLPGIKKFLGVQEESQPEQATRVATADA